VDDINSKTVRLLTGLLAQPNAEALRQIDLQNMELGEFVKAYASAPPIADLAARSSIREDTVIAELSGMLLANGNEPITVVDACCGVGSLAKRILKSMGDQLAVFVISQSTNSLRQSRPFTPNSALLMDLAVSGQFKDTFATWMTCLLLQLT
jgi:hypothetical protein